MQTRCTCSLFDKTWKFPTHIMFVTIVLQTVPHTVHVGMFMNISVPHFTCLAAVIITIRLQIFAPCYCVPAKIWLWQKLNIFCICFCHLRTRSGVRVASTLQCRFSIVFTRRKVCHVTLWSSDSIEFIKFFFENISDGSTAVSRHECICWHTARRFQNPPPPPQKKKKKIFFLNRDFFFFFF